MSQAAIKDALSSLKTNGVRTGADWERAHELAQAHEGEPAYDRLHAFLHRVEGDLANAGYWYRRAGEPVYDQDLESECDLLISRC